MTKAYLFCSNCSEGVVCWDAAGGHRQGATAVFLQEALRPVQEVSHRVGQVGVHDVPEAVLRKVPILRCHVTCCNSFPECICRVPVAAVVCFSANKVPRTMVVSKH